MGEMSKIEEVALGMYEELTSKNVGAGDDLRNVYVADQIDLIALAKVAIAAMRQITEDMENAAIDAVPLLEGKEARWSWEAMIEGALKE